MEKYAILNTYNTNCALSQVLLSQRNGTLVKYIYGVGLIGEERHGYFQTYHYDYRGSTIAITNECGELTFTFEYDTYGKLMTEYDYSDAIFLYNGRDGVITDRNGLVYMRARYYSPEMRRFINADIIPGEISNAITLNRYAYANGNPVSNVDPFGLSVDNRENKDAVNEESFYDSDGNFDWVKFFVSLGVSNVAANYIFATSTVVTAGTVLKALIVAGVFYGIGSNVYSVIESNIVVKNTVVDEDLVKKYAQIGATNSDFVTANLQTNEEMLAYIELFRDTYPDIAKNWSKAEMLREFQYHNRAYDVLSKLPQEGPIPKLVERVAHVDFEAEQTFKTYLFRLCGNMMFW